MQAEWLNNGYVIVRDAVDVTGATDELKSLLPASESDVVHEFGNGGVAEFPCGPVLDTMTVHPKLLWIVRQCLGTERIVLTQSVAWAKYGGQDMGSNADQRVHMDFGNNYWGFPPAQPDMLAAQHQERRRRQKKQRGPVSFRIEAGTGAVLHRWRCVSPQPNALRGFPLVLANVGAM